MQSISALECTLKQALGWHKPRVQCLVQIILGLIAVCSVNLKELACALEGSAQLDSHYRRLQRFFAHVSFPPHGVAYLMAGLFFPDEPMYLSIDRTNWQWGKFNINLWCSVSVTEGLPFLCTGWRCLKAAIQIPQRGLRAAMNLLRQGTDQQSLHQRKLRAAVSDAYREHLLFGTTT